VKGLFQVVLVWLALSVVVMAALSVFVYWRGGRRRDKRPQMLTFDDARVYSFSSSPSTSSDDGDDGKEVPPPEPVITRPVSRTSGALDRLLAGVRLPCGLERLNPEGEDEDLRRAFVTSGVEPRVVAISVADELERLGLDVEPLSYTEARAWRDGLELAVTIFLEPRRVIRGRRAAFPNAPPDAVVIEFSVV
jgi:hypothetical protein